MADINQVISLGLGSPSGVKWIITAGLGIGEPAPGLEIAGLEYTLAGGRQHFTLPDTRPHFTLPPSLAHYTLEEGG